MITTTEEDAENERLSPFSVDGDPRHTHAILTFILLPISDPQPAEKFHGDDCEGLAEIDRPVSLIVALRRQNAVFVAELVTTFVETGATIEAESLPYVAIDSGAGWIRDGCAALYGSLANGNVVCRNSKHGA